MALPLPTPSLWIVASPAACRRISAISRVSQEHSTHVSSLSLQRTSSDEGHADQTHCFFPGLLLYLPHTFSWTQRCEVQHGAEGGHGTAQNALQPVQGCWELSWHLLLSWRPPPWGLGLERLVEVENLNCVNLRDDGIWGFLDQEQECPCPVSAPQGPWCT